MACRGDNARSFRDEELFASSSGVSGKVLSCTNANGVLTRLRPIRESRADAFWKRFTFPPKSGCPFPPLGPSLWPARMRIEVGRTPSIGRRSTPTRG